MPTIVKVKKPKAVVFDFSGTAAKTHFVESVLFDFIKNHFKEYLDDVWHTKEFQEILSKLRKQVEFDRQSDPNIPEIPEKDEDLNIKQAICENINYYIENGLNSEAHHELKFQAWFYGYKKEFIVTP
ncbi:enolase-phosphatase E-1-like protein 3 [Dinothrombium tinctorium]|uniref:Enolase-phosphatase E-1-like protein 3 n=1 Tax=Dinothrombium tinctorium TaxID=1965070 RepID=A0A443RQU5_9ACAR|nr:enolase-phosphatase E-1-like protein 3 [Dinothrombium tinctorium]